MDNQFDRRPMAVSANVTMVPPVQDMIDLLATVDPHGCALRHGDRWLDRRSFVARATALAYRLLGSGVASGSVVAVRLDRSIDQIVACLAVLKAGAAFMPLDPADPVERAIALIDGSAAAATITDAGRAAALGRTSIAIDDPAPATPCPLPSVTPDDLAYVVHTSGSTGTPNGVEITHANFAHLVTRTREAFALAPGDRASHALGLGFDAAIFEVWPALAAGATVHIIDDVVRTSPELLRQALIDQQITVATVPTILAEHLIRDDWPADTALRYLSTGGDVLRVRPRAGLPFAVVNNYGPSECTCQVTSRIVDPQGDGMPSIGRPISGVSVHILDADRHPVAPGVEGEIWVGGAGVARGYRNRPELTAARFQPDPFAKLPGARMYRTGDRGRRADTGEIAFCGRVDQQIKIAGVRIEPEEVAVALHCHPGVGSAAVTAVERDGRKVLAAYIVPSGEDAPDAAELRRFLQRRLPRTHVPGLFVTLAAMPLTGNGKIDRAALPPLERLAPARAGARPLSRVETSVVDLAREALRDRTPTIDDNFFLVGGDSLAATRLVVACGGAFGIPLALSDLFDADTLAEFAATIERRVIDLVANLSDREVATALGRLA